MVTAPSRDPGDLGNRLVLMGLHNLPVHIALHGPEDFEQVGCASGPVLNLRHSSPQGGHGTGSASSGRAIRATLPAFR